MSLNHVLQRYDAIGVYVPRMVVTLDATFTGSAELASMFRDAFGTEAIALTCTAWERAEDGSSLRLAGTASLLGIEEAQVVFTATRMADDDDGDDLLVVLSVQLPSGWSFSQSFPELPAWYDATERDETKRTRSTFLDDLSLGTSRLVFTNEAHHSEEHGADLLPGLNFAGELFFLGALVGIRTLTGEEGPVPLSGPVREYRRTPDPMVFAGIRLRAPLPFAGGEDGPVPLRNPRLLVKSPLDDTQADHAVGPTRDPGIYLFADTEVAGRPAELVAKYAGGADTGLLVLYGRMTDVALSGFSSLSQTLGGDDVEGALPEEVRAPGGLSLTEMGLGVTTSPLGIASVMAGVALDTSWEIVPGALTLEQVGLNVRVTSPFDAKQRQLALTLSGAVDAGGVTLAAYAEYPTWRFGAGLPAGETIPLGTLLGRWLPGSPVPAEAAVTRLLLDADPTAKTFTLACSVTDLLSVPVGSTAFVVEGVGLVIDRRPSGTTGAFTAEMTLAGATAVLTGELTGALTLSGAFRGVDLRTLWTQLTGGEALPDEVPDVTFETLALSVTPERGDVSLRGSATVAWDHLPGGALSTTVQFAFARTGARAEGGASTFTASLSLQGTGPVRVADGFTLGAFDLLFDYGTQAGWVLSGGMRAEVFDASLSLRAGYESRPAGKRLKLQAIAAEPERLFGVDGVGSFSFRQLDLVLERRAGEGGKTETFYDLRLASTLEIEHVMTASGFLAIRDTAEGNAALLFTPDADTATAALDFPAGEGAGFTLSLVECGFVREGAKAAWAFTGTADARITGGPSWMDSILPSRMRAKLVAGPGAARVVALNVTDALPVKLPDVDGKPLGTMHVQITEVGISLKPDLGLVIEAGIGLPAELNTFVGSQLFRVYDPANALQTLSRTRLTISGTGVAAQLVTSPFTSVNAVSVDGEAWFDVDLGDYGALSLKMPTFLYDGVSQYFETSGGCKVTRPLKVPLAPLKLFLRAVGLDAAADIFPDGVPVTRIRLVDGNDDLRVDELISFVKKAGDVPGEVVSVLRETGKLLNRFPDGFKHYFDIEVPTHLEFRVGFSPTGRVALGLSAPEKPVKVLFPAVVPGIVPMPGLAGIELSKLTLGTLSSGSLFYGEIDGVLDLFDLPSLALSLMLPRDEDFPLPTSDQLQRRLVLDDVFCIVPASQGVPVPIPLFYDRIGFEYTGIEGIGLSANVSFPKPPLNGAAAMELFSAIRTFVKDDRALLDPKTPPGGVDLAFTFRDEFLAAPEYLGGGVLGTRGKDIRVGTWEHVARMMNFFKTFSVNDFIGSVPLSRRVGSAEHRFAFMRFDSDWLLTTPSEFRDGAFERLDLSESDRDDFLAVLPSLATTGAQGAGGGEGLVAFVRGEADLSFVRMEAAFGLAASGSMGFGTGFKIAGSLADVIELELRGAVMVNSPLAAAPAGTAASPAAIPATTATAAAPARDRALSLNGKAWVEIPAADSLMLPEYTVEMWVRPAAGQSGWVHVLGIDPGGEQRNLYLELNGDTRWGHRFKDDKGGNSGSFTAKGAARWGQWQHVAMTNDGVTSRTYVDGKEVASAAVTGTLALLRAPLVIGKRPTAKERFFKGELAEVRIWKRARTAAEVSAGKGTALKGTEKDLVSLFRFDSDTGTRAHDVCGRNHGTITGGAWTSSGLSLSGRETAAAASTDSAALRHDGLLFDGRDDFALLPKSGKWKTKAYTVEAWIRPDAEAPATWSCVWGGNGRAPALYVNANGLVSHRFTFTDRSNPLDTREKRVAKNTGTGVVRWGEWNHLAITHDGVMWRTLVNGVVEAEGGVIGTLECDAVEVNVGRSHEGKAEAFFRGSIDDLRFWNRARSADEIRSTMNLHLSGKESGIVAWYDMDHTAGTRLADQGPNALHGTVSGAAWAMAAAPAEPARAALQVLGHAHLDVAGHRALVADLRIVSSEFWFSGTLDLFPSDWPVRVYGHVEGMLGGERFYLSGETENRLFGMTLAKSRLYVSNDRMRLEGRWLGAYTLLDVVWAGSDPSFKGSVRFSASPAVDFGTVRINGYKVADNVRLSLDLLLDVKVEVSRRGFGADVAAKFKVNGVGFSFSFSVDVAPSDLDDLVNWVKQRIIDDAAKYLAHLFADAVAWLKNIGEGVVEFAKDAAEAVGRVLKNAFGVTKEAVAGLMRDAKYTAEQVGAALSRAYGAAETEVAQFLRDARYAVNEVAGAVESAFRCGAEKTAEYLKAARYSANEAAGALKSVYKSGAEAAAKALKKAGYAAAEVGGALRSAYNATEAEAAKALKAAEYGVSEVGGALKSAYNASAETVARAMKEANYAAEEVGSVLNGVYKTSAEEAAKVLRKVDYAGDAVKNTMTSVYKQSSKQAKKLLDGAEDALGGAVNTVGGWLGL